MRVDGASRELASTRRQLVAAYPHGPVLALCRLAVLKGQARGGLLSVTIGEKKESKHFLIIGSIFFWPVF